MAIRSSRFQDRKTQNLARIVALILLLVITVLMLFVPKSSRGSLLLQMQSFDTPSGAVVSSSSYPSSQPPQLRATVHYDGADGNQPTTTTTTNAIHSSFSGTSPTTSTNSKRRPVAILHFGPRKTATTTIQYVLSQPETKAVIANDSFIYLGKGAFTGYKTDAGIFIRDCFFNNDCSHVDDQWIQFVERVQQARRDGTNVILSDEKLFRMLSTSESKQKFRDVFQGFDIRVVFNYRRTFDWIVSEWNQENKDKPTDKDIVPFVDWYRQQLWGEQQPVYYLVDPIVLQPFYDIFPTIQVFNMHEKGAGRDDTMTNFICDMIPEAQSTCQMARNGHLPIPPPERQQLSVQPVVADGNYIARQTAVKLGWTTATTTKEQYDKLSQQIVQYMEQDSTKKIPRRCLSELELEHLFLKSLEIEQAFIPEWHKHDEDEDDEGEIALRKEFQVSVEKGKFCSVDFVTMWTDHDYLSWQNFLREKGEDIMNESVSGTEILE